MTTFRLAKVFAFKELGQIVKGEICEVLDPVMSGAMELIKKEMEKVEDSTLAVFKRGAVRSREKLSSVLEALEDAVAKVSDWVAGISGPRSHGLPMTFSA